MHRLGAVNRGQVTDDLGCEVEEVDFIWELLGHSRSDMVNFNIYKVNSECSGVTW